MKLPLSPVIIFKGLASSFLQASRGMKLVHDYMNVESVPTTSTQQIRDTIVQLDDFRRELLSDAQKNAEDELAASQRFHIGHHMFQVAVAGICLLAETMKPRIHIADQPKLQDVADKLKSLRWDIPYSYVIALQTALNPMLRGKDRAIFEFPRLPHVVLYVVEQKDKILVLDETPFGFGHNIDIGAYAAAIEKEMGDSELTENHIVSEDIVSNIMDRFFSKP